MELKFELGLLLLMGFGLLTPKKAAFIFSEAVSF